MLRRIEPVGLMVLLLLIFAGMAGELIWPLLAFGLAVFTHLAGVPVGQLTGALGLLLGGA